MNDSPYDLDVAIIGGGLVGASLACALAPLGLNIALLEAVPFRAGVQPSYDDRTLALSASSCQILKGLGIWPDIQDNATPIREILVTELDRPGRVALKPEELGLDRFGHVVEARVFGAAVMGIIPKFENVRVLCPAAVNSLVVKEGLARLSYESEGQERQLSARLVVGADGADSFIRKALGIAVEVHDYEQVAVICNITPEQPHRGRAFECFTPSGPFAVMPHVGGRCGLIWCVAGQEAEDLLLCPEEEFLARANKRFGDHLGRFLKMGKRSSYPLRLVTAQEDVRPRVVILGNAAHAIHPVGAQGFNLGLRDVAVLAEVLAEVMAGAIDAANVAPLDDASEPNDVDIGDIALLQRYSEWRAPDQEGTIGYSDGLARMFSNPSPVASTARTIGLIAHAVFPSLRRQLAVRAMGYRGRVPRLALGESLHDSSEGG